MILAMGLMVYHVTHAYKIHGYKIVNQRAGNCNYSTRGPKTKLMLREIMTNLRNDKLVSDREETVVFIAEPISIILPLLVKKLYNSMVRNVFICFNRFREVRMERHQVILQSLENCNFTSDIYMDILLF